MGVFRLAFLVRFLSRPALLAPVHHGNSALNKSSYEDPRKMYGIEILDSSGRHSVGTVRSIWILRRAYVFEGNSSAVRCTACLDWVKDAPTAALTCTVRLLLRSRYFGRSSNPRPQASFISSMHVTAELAPWTPASLGS